MEEYWSEFREIKFWLPIVEIRVCLLTRKVEKCSQYKYCHKEDLGQRYTC
jgi:hypothetical protein